MVQLIGVRSCPEGRCSWQKKAKQFFELLQLLL